MGICCCDFLAGASLWLFIWWWWLRDLMIDVGSFVDLWYEMVKLYMGRGQPRVVSNWSRQGLGWFSLNSRGGEAKIMMISRWQ
jgi:hypothetical protein